MRVTLGHTDLFGDGDPISAVVPIARYDTSFQEGEDLKRSDPNLIVIDVVPSAICG